MRTNRKLLKSFFAATLLFLILGINACGQEENSKKYMKQNEESISKTDEEWKKVLTDEQFYVLRKQGTEAPYSGKLLMNKEKGIYKCAGCGNELFTDKMKFDSHCGWPSFDREISGGKITTREDNSHGMKRIEIECARCGGHLGHLFNDGPTETGMRYCVNSVSLEFVNENELKSEEISEIENTDTITLGGGCYWCIEAVYERLIGVIKVESGFSGGMISNPSYKEVCNGTTGHAEVVQITFDPKKTSLDEIFKVFFTVHDPTTLNRQAGDVGTQYRSVIFYRNEQQRVAAESIIKELNHQKVYDNPIVTQIQEFKKFYKAEDYHQNYYIQNKEQGYCKMVIQPKIEKFEKVFKSRLKN
jgi:peptide methionine sulfoxide reductase msrA/msrB